MTAETYTRTARVFHWVMAAAIIGMLAVGLYMADLDFSPFKLKLYGWHKAVGFLVLVAAVLRVLWRFKHKAPALPTTMQKLEKQVAKAAHLALYGMMFLMPLSGWAMSSAYGFPVSVFGWFTLPNIAPKSKELAGILHEVHEYAGFALIGLIVLHVGAGLYHHFIRKDGVLRRMWVVLFLLGVSPAAFAADWALDAEHSELKFTAKFNHAPSEGVFTHITPALDINLDDFSQTTGKITVDLTKINAAYPMVATTLQQKDWFHTAQWPEGTFEIVQILPLAAENTYQVTGNLKLRATTQPLTLTAHVTEHTPTHLKLTATGTLSRTAYGIGQGEWLATDVVADAVALDIQAVFRRSATK